MKRILNTIDNLSRKDKFIHIADIITILHNEIPRIRQEAFYAGWHARHKKSLIMLPDIASFNRDLADFEEDK